MGAKSSYTWVGWQGIVAEAPADWSLAAVSGDANSGYFRVDSAGSLTLEVKWSNAPKQVDLHDKVEVYLNDLRRKARKRKLRFEHKIKAKSAAAEGAVSFTWRSDRKAQGRIWRCDECERVIIAQVSGDTSDDISTVASVILPSVEDHAADGWRTWALYDLIAEVPPGYVLEKHQLMSGYIQLQFRKRHNRLTIERWGLANVVLKKSSLSEWFRERVQYDLKSYRYTVEDIDFDGEAGIQISGRRAGVRQMVRSATELLTLRRPALYLDGYVWTCEESNKIYSVQAMHARGENIIDQVLERVECH